MDLYVQCHTCMYACTYVRTHVYVVSTVLCMLVDIPATVSGSDWMCVRTYVLYLVGMRGSGQPCTFDLPRHDIMMAPYIFHSFML